MSSFVENIHTFTIGILFVFFSFDFIDVIQHNPMVCIDKAESK